MENPNSNRIRLNENTLKHAFDVVAQSMGRQRLTLEEQNEIRNNGLQILLRRGAPSGIQREEYAIFPLRNEGSMPRLKVEYCPSSSGHVGLVEGSIVGGTLFGNRFGGLSSTWSTKSAIPGSPEYDLGVEVNKFVLDKFGVEYR
jgi:hypothetical protein